MEPPVEKRHKHIHNKDGERHTLRVSAEVAYHHQDETDTYAVNHASEGGHRRSHVVGSHKAGSENDSTGEQIEQRVGIGRRVDEVENA